MSKKCPCCGAIIMVLVKGTAECFRCPFVCAIKDFHIIAAAMEAEARHNALVEAVKKMLDANSKDCWDALGYTTARAEVDRLIAEGHAE